MELQVFFNIFLKKFLLNFNHLIISVLFVTKI
jgi:hypothetical protein